MRVTTKSMYEQVLRDVTGRLQAYARASEQVSSGRRLSAVSDDPVAGSQALRADQGLRAVVQYRRSVAAVRTRLDMEESVLSQVTDLLTRARELAVSQSGSNANGQTRAASAEEVTSLIEQAIALGNSRVGNDFVFGGTATGAPPFQADGTYVGSGAARSAEIGAGEVVSTAHTGQELLIDSGVLPGLISLRDRLATNDEAGIVTSLGQLDVAFDATQSLLAGAGAKGRRLDQALAGLDAIDTALTQSKSDAIDVPMEEALIQLASIQSALQAAILSGTRVLNANLTEYYR